MVVSLYQMAIKTALGLTVLAATVRAAAIPSTLQVRANAVASMNGANFPDPSVIRTPSGWYAYSTNAKLSNGAYVHVQIAHTPDYQTWTLLTGQDALPNLPAWVDPNSPRVWAPQVVQVKDGSFVMYYTAATKQDTSKHCLGIATSKSVTGPFVPNSNSPWVCPLSQGGAIDPSGYMDPVDGSRWVVYKIDGNSLGHGGACMNTVAPIVPTPIMLQQVDSATGTQLIGQPVQILTNIPSDGPYVEAPSLNKMGGKYVLFFSTNCFATPQYDVQYATATNIRGPYTRQGKILATGVDGLNTPGSLNIAVNGDHFVFHAASAAGRALYSGVMSLNAATNQISKSYSG